MEVVLQKDDFRKPYKLPSTDKGFRITNMKKYITFLLLTFMISCKSVPENQQITVASGGGITGIWHEYTLKPDGQILHKASNVDSTEVVKTLSKSKTKNFFKQIEVLKLDEKKMDEPGNMSYFVQFSERKKFSHKVQWGDKTMPADSVKTFYDTFMALVR